MACGTCHQPGVAGTDPRIAIHPGLDLLSTADDRRTSFGVVRSDAANEYIADALFLLKPQATPRAANSMINAAYAPTLFWDGRALGQFIDPQTGQVAIAAGGALESQAIGPIVSPVEMGHEGLDWSDLTARLTKMRPLETATSLPSDVNTALAGNPDYPELFRRAFGDTNITARRVAFAIATYQRTLISDDSPFDRFQAGTGSLTPQQQQGFNAFFGANCSVCHFANNLTFTNHSFRNIGLRPNADDRGLGAITGNPADDGKFKTPTLRNAGLKRTFMHNGQFTTLEQVLAFYAAAPLVNPVPPNRDPLMTGTGLSASNQAAVVEFIRNALTDARVRNQTFPFDRPTLYIDRPADLPVLLGGGVAGTGGTAPAIILDGPAFIGNLEYRVGVATSGALVGGSATLAVSSIAPVGGVLTPDYLLPAVPINGSASTAGAATVKWPIKPGTKTNGQTLYVQWLVPDAGAPGGGGEARSEIARIRFFCSSRGCPQACPLDLDGSNDIGVADLFHFLDAWFVLDVAADFDGDLSVEVEDLFGYLDGWFASAGTNCP